MNNELSVSLNLDLSNYEREISDALKIFNGFQKALSDPKLKFTDFQISELSKIFDQFRGKALSEISKVQKSIQKLEEKKTKIQFEMDQKGILDEWEAFKAKTEAQKIELEAKGMTEGATYKNLEANLQAFYDKNIKPYEQELQGYDNQISKLKIDYNGLLNYLRSNPLIYDFYNPDFAKFNTEIDNVKNGFKKTGEEVDKAKEKVNQFAGLKSKMSIFGRIFSQIKNTIATALNPLNMFRKAWNEIIMTDTSRFGATFENIGNNIMEYLTPALETVANIILRCLAYLNQLLKALSGGKIDLFKLSSKSAKKMQGSVAKTKELLAGFDEINDIASQSGGGGGGAGSIVSPFSELEVMKNSEDIWNDISKAVQGAKTSVDEYSDEIRELIYNDEVFDQAYGDWDDFVQGFSLIWLGLVDFFRGIWDVIEGILKFFAHIFTADFDQLEKDIEQIWNGLLTAIGGFGEFVVGVLETAWGFVKGLALMAWRWLWDNFFTPIGEWVIKKIEGILTAVRNFWENIKTTAWNVLTSIGNWVINKINGVRDAIFGFINKCKTGLSTFINWISSSVDKLATGIKKVPSSIWSGIKGMINSIIGGINTLIKGINKIKFDVPDWVPGIGGKKMGFDIPTIPKLEVGTNYVPQDTLAMIHKGEAVIPKEFNSQEYFGTGNEEVINKLDQLIEVLENKDMTVSISKQAIGQASVDYQRYENRRLGRRLV